MDQLITSAVRSFRSLNAPGMAAIFVKSLVITVIFLALIIALITYGANIASHNWQDSQYAEYITWIAGIGALIFAWFMLPCIMPLIVSFFADSIIINIENHEYPPASPPIKNSFAIELWHDLKFALKALFLNIILIPFYFIPLVNIAAFLAANGYLLGSEFYLAVARRHLPYREALAKRKQNSSLIFLGGIMLVFLSTIPIINFIAPFWGVALMTHIYHLNNSALSVENRKL